MKAAFSSWIVRLPIAISVIAMSLAVTFSMVKIFVEFNLVGSVNIDGKLLHVILLSISLLGGQYFMNAARVGDAVMMFGFAPTRFAFRHYLQGFAAALTMVGILFGLYFLAGAEITKTDGEWSALPTVLIFFAALMEELVFRGLLFEPFSERFGEAKTAVGISLLFAAAHIPNPNASIPGIFNVAMAGILLSIMRIASRTLWMPLGFHFGWNWTLGVGLGMTVSGQDFSPIFNTKLIGSPSIWLGGAFGVEESISATLLLFIAVAVTVLYTKADPFVAAAEFRRRYAEDRLLHREAIEKT